MLSTGRGAPNRPAAAALHGQSNQHTYRTKVESELTVDLVQSRQAPRRPQSPAGRLLP